MTGSYKIINNDLVSKKKEDSSLSLPMQAILKKDLKQLGIELEKRDYTFSLDKDGDSLLHFAVIVGSEEILKFLLKHYENKGMDINIINSKSETPFLLACKLSKDKLALSLAEANAKLEIVAQEKSSALQLAIRNGLMETIDAILLKNPGLIEQLGSESDRPLHEAVKNKDKKILDKILSYKPELNATNSYGKTPLHIAVEAGNQYAVEELIKAGADINFRNNIKDTPLMTAIVKGHMAIVKTLLKSNATQHTGLGMSLSEFALSHNRKDIADYINKFVAKNNAPAKKGFLSSFRKLTL